MYGPSMYMGSRIPWRMLYITRKPLSLFQVSPKISPQPTPIPQSLHEFLVAQQLDWTSQSWVTLFRSCLRQVWLTSPNRHIEQARSGSYTKFCAAVSLSPFPAAKLSLSAFVAFPYRVGLAARSSHIIGSEACPNCLWPRGPRNRVYAATAVSLEGSQSC